MSRYQDLAAKMYARSAKYGNVRGDGEFLLLTKCNRWRWIVLLYPTQEARDEKAAYWARVGCGKDCVLDHSKRQLVLGIR